MATYPYSRTVDVTVTREDRFPSVQGFQTALLLVSDSGTGGPDAETRTRLYSSIEEVAEHYDAADEPYKAALRYFQRNPRPRQLKMGFWDSAAVAAEESDMADELDTIFAFDPGWYWLLHTKELADTDNQKAIADWAEAKTVLFGADTADADTETVGALPASCFAAYAKDKQYDRTASFYHTDLTNYMAAAAFAYTSRRDLDVANYELARRGRIDSGQAYTAKFKELTGVSYLNKPSGVIQAITGWVPGLGFDATQGNYANAYVNTGGRGFLVEGNVASTAFIDEIHALDWLRARVQESVLGVLLNTPRVPMTNDGVDFLIAAGIEPVMRRAIAAGIIATELDDSGDLLAEYEINHERVENVLASQRRNRVCPDIYVTFRYAGAIHYVTVRMVVRF